MPQSEAPRNITVSSESELVKKMVALYIEEYIPDIKSQLIHPSEISGLLNSSISETDALLIQIPSPVEREAFFESLSHLQDLPNVSTPIILFSLTGETFTLPDSLKNKENIHLITNVTNFGEMFYNIFAKTKRS